ncbi:MAG: biotin--[acetyl-CoA-carboxylase] ligase [Armatimonadetes bacterium]|nr:biotin--[acetyl-CoA-carboxylase] ligase [Armatimonadota bacterium]
MGRIGCRVVHLDEVTSTIDVARRLAEEGAAHGTVVRAERQTSGRGRRGRVWTTIPGKSLAMTTILRDLPAPDRLGLAGMAAALGVVLAADSALDLALRTKWPNDVVADGRKVAGTLAELHGEVLLLSLGLNINGAEADLPADLREAATTLELLCGRPLDREPVTARVIGGLDASWQMLLAAPEAVLAAWEALDVTLGEEVIARTAKGRSLTGRALGVDATGRLLLRRADGEIVPLAAGDVTLKT